MKKISVMAIVLSSFLYSVVYENGEDGSINRWVAQAGATVNNVVDNDTGSRVIKFNSSSYKYYKMGNLATNSDKKIQWDIKANNPFIVYVNVSTSNGDRLFYYTTINRDNGVTGNGMIHHGIGENKAYGNWNTITRDLDADLQESEPNNSVTGINWFKIRATGDVFVDNIIGDGSGIPPTDKIAPSITLNGNSTVIVPLNGTYTEQGATAVDNIDGVVAVTTIGSVDTSTVGLYTVTYRAVDSAGNSSTKTRTVKVQDSSNCSVIEDAEDGSTSRWTAPGVTVTNEVDTQTGSNVIKLSSNTYKYSRMDNLNSSAKKIQWDIKTNHPFIVYINVSTSNGNRLFYYTTINRDNGVTGNMIHHGVGEDKAYGSWSTITRDLEAELHESEPNNNILSINSFKIRSTGDVFLDNIKACSGGSVNTNHTPVANAGPDQTVNDSTQVQLNGSASSDADSDPLTYAWSFVSKPSGSSATLSDATLVNPTFVADVIGSYTLQLVVNDGQVDSVADTVTITATTSSGGNTPPPAINPTGLVPQFD